jgi:hypothetical protein
VSNGRREPRGFLYTLGSPRPRPARSCVVRRGASASERTCASVHGRWGCECNLFRSTSDPRAEASAATAALAVERLRFVGSYRLLKLASALAYGIFAVDTSECPHTVKFRGIVRPRWYSARFGTA